MAAGTEIAKAYVQIVPSAQGISGKIQEALDPEARSAGQSAGQTIGEQIGSFATKAIAALGIGKMISDSITNGMDFETSMAKASTLFSGTDAELQQLQNDIVSISSATGVAASELAEAAYSAESASVPMGNLGGMIESSAKLATAGFTDIDTALSATAKTMNAYGMMSEDAAETQANMEKVQRILIQTQNKGITTVGELGASLAQVTPTAAAFGVSFENVGAALAGMTAQGTPTAQATTQLNSLIAELGKEGTTASKNLLKAADGSKYAGMSFSEMMENGADLNDVLGMMQSLADENNLAMVDMFSSIEAGKAAMSITNSDWVGNMESMATQADVVTNAYSTMADTTGFKLEQMKTTLKNLGISAFSEFAGPLSNALQGVSTILTNIKPALDILWSAFQSLGSTIAGIVGDLFGFDENMSAAEVLSNALSTVIETLAGMIQILADNMSWIAPIAFSLVSAFTAFRMVTGVQGLIGDIPKLITSFQGLFAVLSANPIGIVIAAVAALVAGIVYLWNTNEDFRNAVKAIWDKICSGIVAAKDSIVKAWDAIKEKAGKLKDDISQKFTQIKDSIKEKINAAKDAVHDAIEKIKGFFKFEWSLPHLKMPHFHMEGEFSLMPPSVPHISVDWYKKAYQDPVLFTKPTVLQTPGGLKGFGDGAGAEVVMGLNKLKELAGGDNITININGYNRDATELAREIERELVRIQKSRSAVFA